MNNNINFNIAKANSALDILLSNLPVGVAYLLLKNKLQEIEPLYYAQAQKELDQMQNKQQKQGQE